MPEQVLSLNIIFVYRRSSQHIVYQNWTERCGTV